jgi:SAM-dependent methyltransferase
VNCLSDPNYLRSEQYHSSSNLERRIALHTRFSVNPQGWQRWVFEQLGLRNGSRVLELGCGPGTLWLDNLERMPRAGEMILSDFSSGMVDQAQENLAGKIRGRFEIIDARSIPYPAASFDGVIANHMLYHVPERKRALAEMRRVLRPGGRLYATTVGEQHMAELYELVQKFDTEIAAEGWYLEPIDFSLENGHTQLSGWFDSIELRRYDDALLVTEAMPLVDYILSTVRLNLGEERRDDLYRYIQAKLDINGGTIRITKDSGIFIASV